jgi:hypothetical protein
MATTSSAPTSKASPNHRSSPTCESWADVLSIEWAEHAATWVTEPRDRQNGRRTLLGLGD